MCVAFNQWSSQHQIGFFLILALSVINKTHGIASPFQLKIRSIPVHDQTSIPGVSYVVTTVRTRSFPAWYEHRRARHMASALPIEHILSAFSNVNVGAPSSIWNLIVSIVALLVASIVVACRPVTGLPHSVMLLPCWCWLP